MEELYIPGHMRYDGRQVKHRLVIQENKNKITRFVKRKLHLFLHTPLLHLYTCPHRVINAWTASSNKYVYVCIKPSYDSQRHFVYTIHITYHD